jgi:D-alanyl-D-alanine carboxypeptidase
VRNSRPPTLWPWLAVGGLALGLFWLPTKSDAINRDVDNLLPAFAERLARLFTQMRALGFDPYLREGWRSPERAQRLAQSDVGITDSMHIYGAAADVVPRQASKATDAKFFAALGAQAEKLGLTWGGRFVTRVDQAHVQAIPVQDQTVFRALPGGARNVFVQQRLA